MPLRFDEPELLGKWEGDSAPMHQAIANIARGSDILSDGLKKQRPKTPSYKIDTAKAPFQKDQELIGQHVTAAIEAVNRGENPEAVLQKAEQVAAMSQAQKNALEQSKVQTNELQQAYGNAIDPTPINNSINSAYNDHDINTRGQVLGDIQKNIADPSEKMFNSEKHTSNIFLSRPEQSLVYTNKDENGNVNIGNERKVTGRLLVPDTKRPQYEFKNNKKVPLVDANGQPVYEMRNATTIDDALPEAKALFDNDRNYADWTTKQVARSDKETIDQLTADWISSERNRPDGGVPSKEVIEAKKQLIARDLAERKVAKQLLQLDRGATVSSPTRTLDEPRQQTKADRDSVWDINSMGSQGSDYNTKFGQKGEVGGFKTHGGIVIKNKNGKKPTLTINEQTAKNEASGKYEDLTEGTEAELDNVRSAYWMTTKDKKGNEHQIKMAQKNPIQELRKLTPKQVVEDNIVAEPVAYLTAKQTSGAGNLGLSPEELKEYNELKPSFTGDNAETIELDPNKEGYDPKQVGKYNRFQELEAQKSQKTKTYSLPYNKVQGQLGMVIGNKNASKEALMKSMGEKQYNEYLEGKKILEEKRKQYYDSKNKPMTAAKKYSSVQEDAINHVMSKNKGATREQVIDALIKAGKLQ